MLGLVFRFLTGNVRRSYNPKCTKAPLPVPNTPPNVIKRGIVTASALKQILPCIINELRLPWPNPTEYTCSGLIPSRVNVLSPYLLIRGRDSAVSSCSGLTYTVLHGPRWERERVDFVFFFYVPH